jgi:MoaA/NifB/PqqE/SkfB family radical SAM enzyme
MCESRREYEIQIEIENQCYLDCQHCSSLSIRHTVANSFHEEDLVNFIQLFDGHPIHVYFSGGEPLANPNLTSLIKLVKGISSNNNVGIFTCGILKNTTSIDEVFAKKLKNSGLDDCYISLYHYVSEKHDLITNLQGSYYATVQSIRNLIDAKIDVKVNLVINRYNYQELDKIIANILGMGVSQVRLLRLVKAGAAKINWNVIGVSYQEQNIAIKKIINNIDTYSGSVTIAGFPAEIACRPTKYARKCQAGTHLLLITNSKQVYPCACTKNNPYFAIGSIYDLIKLKHYLEKQQHHLYNEQCLNPIIDD